MRQICLTHSFPYKDVRAYNGKNDCNEEETLFIKEYLENTEYDDYDRLYYGATHTNVSVCMGA